MKPKHPSGRPIRQTKVKGLPLYRNIGEGFRNDRLDLGRLPDKMGFLAARGFLLRDDEGR